jgi:hypothetical protein
MEQFLESSWDPYSLAEIHGEIAKRQRLAEAAEAAGSAPTEQSLWCGWESEEEDEEKGGEANLHGDPQAMADASTAASAAAEPAPIVEGPLIALL